MPSDDIVARLRGITWMGSDALCQGAADEIERLREQLRLANIDNFNTTAEIERLRAVIKTQQDRIEQSVRDNDRTVYLCAARYDRLQTIRDLVVKHGVVDPLRHEIMRQTDLLD